MDRARDFRVWGIILGLLLSFFTIWYWVFALREVKKIKDDASQATGCNAMVIAFLSAMAIAIIILPALALVIYTVAIFVLFWLLSLITEKRMKRHLKETD